MSWRTVSLGEVANVGAGNSAPQEDRLFENGTHNFYRTSDVGRIRTGVISESSDKLNSEGIRGLKLHSIGTILFPKSGASTFLNHRVMLGKEGYVSSHLATIKAKADVANDKFLLYFLSTIDAKNLVQDSNYPSLKTSVIEKIIFSLPSLSTQQKIVTKLDAIFAEIDKATAVAEANARNAERLFQSYLTEIFERGGKGWINKTVNELVIEKIIQKPFDGNHGEIHPVAADYTSSGIPFLMASDLKNGFVDLVNCKFLPKKITDNLRVGFAKNDDLLITHKGTIGRVAKLKTELDYVMLTPQVTSYRVLDINSLSKDFLYYFFQSGYFQSQLYEMAKGGSTRAYAGITKQNSLLIKIPPIEEQERFSKLFQQFEFQKAKLPEIYASKVKNLQLFKQSILRQAFTGELIKE